MKMRRTETEVSILVQGHRLADPGEEKACRESESAALSQWMKSDLHPWFDDELNPDPPQANAWFIIRDTAKEGLKVSEIFRGLPEDQALHSRQGTSCVFVGSKLYEIGGLGSTLATSLCFSNKIRRLDTQNPEAGWKTDTLPFYSADVTATVSGNSIYLFPNGYPFYDSPEGAYIYDTVKQKARPILLPPGVDRPSMCFPRKRKGVVVPVEKDINDDDDDDDSGKFYLHNREDSSWKSLNADALGLPCRQYHQPYAVSNGMLYVFDETAMSLSVYDITKPKASLLCQINLPEFENLGEGAFVFLVPLADSNICFLWHAELHDVEQDHPQLCYAKVSLCLDPPAATLLKQATLGINAVDISSCLPFAIPQGMPLQKYIGAEFPVIESKKPVELEDLRRLYKHLLSRVEHSEKRNRIRNKRMKRTILRVLERSP